MATTARRSRIRVEATASEQQQSVLTDDLLLEIFLRIGCPADLTRTSAACVAFRRLIADPTFLRRYRSHNTPLHLGILSTDPLKGFHPVEPPHPNAPAARALANVSFDFLPPGRIDRWYIFDVRDGRVLLDCSDVEPDLVVCDPLSRRYIMLPPIPWCGGNDDDFDDSDALFVPCTDRNDEMSFRVMVMMRYSTGFVVLFLDSGSSSWTTSKSYSWEAVGLHNGLEEEEECPRLICPCYAYGCFYWKVNDENKLLKIKINTMEPSIVCIPPDHELNSVAVVEVGEGILGMFSRTLCGKFLNYYHYYNSQIADEWQMKNAIPLSVHGDLCIVGAVQGYIFLQCYQQNVKSSVQTGTYYSVDIKNLKLERVMQISSSTNCLGRPYFGFPSSMSPRLI